MVPLGQTSCMALLDIIPRRKDSHLFVNGDAKNAWFERKEVFSKLHAVYLQLPLSCYHCIFASDSHGSSIKMNSFSFSFCAFWRSPHKVGCNFLKLRKEKL